MSIETLLEAAKFLELQAQQQQKARGKFSFFIRNILLVFLTYNDFIVKLQGSLQFPLKKSLSGIYIFRTTDKPHEL